MPDLSQGGEEFCAAVTLCDPLDTLDLFSWRHESIAVAIADP
jgi:hypothetical protein